MPFSSSLKKSAAHGDQPTPRTDNGPTTGGLFAVFLLFLLLFLKGVLFYGQLNLQHYDVPFALATCAILAAVSLILYHTVPRAAFPTLFTLYTVGCCLMAIDSTYYAYVAKMPSAAQIGMVGLLDDVFQTIRTLVKWKQIAMLIDFPLWFLYWVNHDPVNHDPVNHDPVNHDPVNHDKTRRFSRPVQKKVVTAAGILLCVLSLGAVLTSDGFQPRYMVNELYCYHLYDFARTIGGSVSERKVDKSLYTVKAQRDSEYFGLAKGRNVVVIQVEALQNFVIGASYHGQTLTPNLNALIQNDSFYFDRYYYQIGGGNTCDAEFAVNNSLFGPENEAGYVKYTDNDFNGLPFLLKQNGYSGAWAFHGYYGDFWNREAAYVKQGFDGFKSLEDYEETDMFSMGISDRELFRQAMADLSSFEEPFYSFFITVSSHHPYAIPLKDREIILEPEDEATLFGLYLQAVNYVDRVIGEFIEMLKEADLYDNTILVLYGDHYALTNTDAQIAGQVSSMLGRSYTVFDVFSVPLLIHVPGMGSAQTIETAGGHIDVLPTLLCLLGLENDKTVMFGQNLLTAEHGFVCEQTHMAKGSFISDEVFFKRPYNNIEANFAAYQWGTMALLNPSEYTDLSDYAYNRIEDCRALLDQNDIFLDPSQTP